LFALGGYANTRVDDVAEAARLSKPRLYELFESKQAIYVAVVEHELAVVRDALVRPTIADGCNQLSTASARLLARFWYLQAWRPAALTILLGPSDWRVEHRIKKTFQAELKEAIEGCVRPHLGPAGIAIPPHTYADLLLAFALSTSEFLAHDRMVRREVREVTRHVRLLLRGWAASPLPLRPDSENMATRSVAAELSASVSRSCLGRLPDPAIGAHDGTCGHATGVLGRPSLLVGRSTVPTSRFPASQDRDAHLSAVGTWER
jgi:AcrR family transcriptional regulator